MKLLKENVRLRIEKQSKEIAEILKNNSETEIGTVTVKHLMGGMRGLKAMVCNTSYVDPYKGLIISGHDVPSFSRKTPEEIFYLLSTGSFPNKEELEEMRNELAKRHEAGLCVDPFTQSSEKHSPDDDVKHGNSCHGRKFGI